MEDEVGRDGSARPKSSPSTSGRSRVECGVVGKGAALSESGKSRVVRQPSGPLDVRQENGAPPGVVSEQLEDKWEILQEGSLVFPSELLPGVLNLSLIYVPQNRSFE